MNAPVASTSTANAGTVTPPSVRRPWLLFDESELPKIRANVALPRFAALWEKLSSNDRADDLKFLEHDVRLNRTADDLGRVRILFEHAAFVYAVNRDPRQLALAKLALRRILGFARWDHFLEDGKVFGLLRAPETAMAVSFGLDWIGDSLTPEEIAEAEEALAEKGAAPCYLTLYGMRYPERVKGWIWNPDENYRFSQVDLKRWPLILNSTNLKTVPAAGLGIAACRLHGRHPQAELWLNQARRSMAEFATMYGMDGSYDEGPSYWVPTTIDVALFAETLWRSLGLDDRKLINYPGTIQYAISMTMPRLEQPAASLALKDMGIPLPLIPPAYDVVNFGDTNGGVEITLATWVGRNFQDPVAQFLAQQLGEVKYYYGPIWYDEEAPLTRPAPEFLDHRLPNDIVVSRTGWDPMDSVLALRSGGPANHEHPDRNAVIFKAHGERLLHDPFRAGYSYTLDRWKLRLTGAHTAILINGQGHEYHDGSEGTNPSWSFAAVTAFAHGPGWMTVSSEATEPYALINPAVRRVERTLIFLKPDVLIFHDRVEMDGADATVQARFQVFNEDELGSGEAAGPTFQIRRPFAALHARVAATGEFTVTTGRIDLPPAEGNFPYVEVSTTPARSHILVTACTTAPAGEAHGELTITRAGDTWQIRGVHRGRKIAVDVGDVGKCPPTVKL